MCYGDNPSLVSLRPAPSAAGVFICGGSAGDGAVCGPDKRLHGGRAAAPGGEVVISVVFNNKNKLDCTPLLRHETTPRKRRLRRQPGVGGRSEKILVKLVPAKGFEPLTP